MKELLFALPFRTLRYCQLNCLLLTAFLLFSANSLSQDIMVSGLVLDSTRKFILPNVKVTSTSGRVTYTDSLGAYNIMVTSEDSINFTYRNRPTMWYPVREMKNTRSFDIALQVTLTDGYKTLREVILIGKSYRQDSIENRMKYQKVFNGSTGGLRINPSGGDNLYGGAGLDPNEIINLFRFRRNRNLKSLQNRLLQEESDKFINYRFNKDLVKQITGFTGSNLERFMKIWRPDYEFTALSSDLEFHTYILEASRAYTRGEMPWKYRE
ncbi:MAG TPA: hypothetical protein VLA58_06140 [Chitinophagaceae bacterium]|nr:hypothetical protein [Chitinophagaceae bacterium]